MQIYHVGEADGLPFLELEYLPGGSLEKLMNGTPRPAAAAARLIEALARAIAEAHRRGIVHRDLKPANVLLDSVGHPKVADFGLAKILDSEDGLTKTHLVIGSPSYMAPEQATGDARSVGTTADVYALGAILYELLTGRPPFKAATALETLEQVKAIEPVAAVAAPAGLAAGHRNDLSEMPGEGAVPAIQHGRGAGRGPATPPGRRTDPARPASTTERVWKWARRRPAAAAAVFIVTVTAFGAPAGRGLHYNAKLRDDNARLEGALGQARSAQQQAQASASDAVSSGTWH